MAGEEGMQWPTLLAQHLTLNWPVLPSACHTLPRPSSCQVVDLYAIDMGYPRVGRFPCAQHYSPSPLAMYHLDLCHVHQHTSTHINEDCRPHNYVGWCWLNSLFTTRLLTSHGIIHTQHQLWSACDLQSKTLESHIC